MRLAAVIVLALASAIATDIATVGWLTLLRPYVDLTGHYWLAVVLPVVTAIVVLQALVLWWAYRASPRNYAAVYLTVYAITEVVWLNLLQNPPGDILRYLVIIIAVGAAVMAAFTRFAWRANA